MQNYIDVIITGSFDNFMIIGSFIKIIFDIVFGTSWSYHGYRTTNCHSYRCYYFNFGHRYYLIICVLMNFLFVRIPLKSPIDLESMLLYFWSSIFHHHWNSKNIFYWSFWIISSFAKRCCNVNLIYDNEKKTRKTLSTLPSLQVFLVSIYLMLYSCVEKRKRLMSICSLSRI